LTFTFSEAVYGVDDDVTVLDPDSNPIVPDSIAGWATDTLVVGFTTPLILEGEYTVTLSGTSTIEDLAGNALGGGVDEVRTFTLMSETLEGDLNGDGFVGGDDLDIVRAHWGQNVTPWDLLAGDASGDGFVGGDDLDIVRSNWGSGMPPAPVATIPEAEEQVAGPELPQVASAEYGPQFAEGLHVDAVDLVMALGEEELDDSTKIPSNLRSRRLAELAWVRECEAMRAKQETMQHRGPVRAFFIDQILNRFA